MPLALESHDTMFTPAHVTVLAAVVKDIISTVPGADIVSFHPRLQPTIVAKGLLLVTTRTRHRPRPKSIQGQGSVNGARLPMISFVYDTHMCISTLTARTSHQGASKSESKREYLLCMPLKK